MMSIIMTSAAILVAIKASLHRNSWLLKANLTRKAAKIAVLDGFSYPELRYLGFYLLKFSFVIPILPVSR